MIKLNRKLELLAKLRNWMLEQPAELQIAILEAEMQNLWFTPYYIQNSIKEIAENYLNENALKKWLEKYPQIDNPKANNLKLALVFPGNIPLAGFHDFLCGFLSGFTLICKLSDKDKVLMTAVFEFLIKAEPKLTEYIHWTDRKLGDFDAVIATGSNNTGRYFQYYFGNYPNIIRGHRNSVAVLTGRENEAQLKLIARDVYTYFGLGCRNITKIMIPENFDFENFLAHLKTEPDPCEHNKYRNNYDYKLAVKMINREMYMCNSQIILNESEQLDGGISVLNYEVYSNSDDLLKKLKRDEKILQCIIAEERILGMKHEIAPGSAQSPQLWDYSDHIDTMNFLLNLHEN